MFHSRRPSGRFFCWLSLGLILLTWTARSVAITARTTRITDTVFRADGTPARGSILISWPAFTDANGAAVAAGRTSVTIGSNGAIDFPLVANTGSAPMSYYTVVLKLDDGSSATEYWTVPSASTTTVAAIRSRIVPASVATQSVGRDYVDSAVSSANAGLNAAIAAKANDDAVVHYASDETISGTKTFSASPVVPTPTAAAQAANKSYVDSAVQGSFGNMLSANPAASQIITQPAGTSLQVNRADLANFNGIRNADRFPTIQDAVNDAGTTGSVVIPPGYTGQDNFSNPQARSVVDLRRIGDARGGDISVKDFGARGDGGWYSQVACNSGSPVITNVAAIGGRLPRVGDTFLAAGCGASGADLQCTLSAASGVPYGSVTCGGGVTAGATAVNRGSRWGASLDDTAAFAAAINYCTSVRGCKIRVPSGVYFVSNLVFPAAGSGSGSIFLQGTGRTSSWLIGIGADRSAVLKAPPASVPTYVADLGFQSFDYNKKTQTAIQWLGGQEHTFTNNFVSNMYEMVNASNTWINLISNNRCYVMASHCIEFGTGQGNDTVNATRVVFNELSAWGYPNHDTTAHAYYVHSGSASYENTFAFNSIEHDNGPIGEPIDANDNLSHFFLEYAETSGGVTPYFAIFRGTGQQVRAHGIGCIQVTGLNVAVYGEPIATCPSQTYSIKNDGTGLLAFGFSPENLSQPVNANASAYGFNVSAGAGVLRTYANQPGTANDWPGYGRVDLASSPFTTSNSSSISVYASPTNPSQFGANAVIPTGTIVRNGYVNYGPTQPLDNNVFWICDNNGGSCSANPPVPSQWKRFGEKSSKVRAEATAVPTGGTWSTGDFLWNTNPSPGGALGWICTAAGSPGTWSPVYQFDPASPPAIGATAPNTVKATTVNATSGYQVNGTPVQSSCGTTTTCANTAVPTGRMIYGSVALASGSATVTGISPAFTSTSSFLCTCTDRATTAAACSVQNASASSITLKGTSTDTINYICVGN